VTAEVSGGLETARHPGCARAVGGGGQRRMVVGAARGESGARDRRNGDSCAGSFGRESRLLRGGVHVETHGIMLSVTRHVTICVADAM
jgi:hypothetical protein